MISDSCSNVCPSPEPWPAVVSRRMVLESERESMRDELLSDIAVEQVRKGIVKNVTDFGVFIDLGGVDGLLHITDMSWGRVKQKGN